MRHSRFAVSRPGVSQGADAMESTIDTLQNEKLSSHDESAKLDPVLLSPLFHFRSDQQSRWWRCRILDEKYLRDSEMMIRMVSAIVSICLLMLALPVLRASDEAADSAFLMIVPGFSVRELPLKLTGLNNLKNSAMTVVGLVANVWMDTTVTIASPAKKLDISYHTLRDPRPRALPVRQFLMPFANPALPDQDSREIPEIAGGNYQAGRALFTGKSACSTCHQLRGEGFRVGADLGNLVHRDYESVLRDMVNPNATINPDAIGYLVQLKDRQTLTGTRMSGTETGLELAIPGKNPLKIQKAEMDQIDPMAAWLMPAEIEKLLSEAEMRDLMTYLLSEPPKPKTP